MKPSIYVVDHFYDDPERIRKIGLGLCASEETEEDSYFPPGIKRKFRSIVGHSITKWNGRLNAFDEFNGSFSVTHRNQPLPALADFVHHDFGAYEYVGLIYLTPDAPLSAGTSFWRHRATGLCVAPTPNDARRLGTSVEALNRRLEDDRVRLDAWELLDHVGNVYNRALIFRASRLHSASGNFGGNRVRGRLVHRFSFSTL